MPFKCVPLTQKRTSSLNSSRKTKKNEYKFNYILLIVPQTPLGMQNNTMTFLQIAQMQNQSAPFNSW
jgi:hypothetical protein